MTEKAPYSYTLAEVVKALRQSPAFPHLRGMFFHAVSHVADCTDLYPNHPSNKSPWMGYTGAYRKKDTYCLEEAFVRVACHFGGVCQVCGRTVDWIHGEAAMLGMSNCWECSQSFFSWRDRKNRDFGMEAFVEWLAGVLKRKASGGKMAKRFK